MASTCKPQYDPQDAPEPESDLRERVHRLESVLKELTGGTSDSPPASPVHGDSPIPVGTVIVNGTTAGTFSNFTSQYPSPIDSLNSRSLDSVSNLYEIVTDLVF